MWKIRSNMILCKICNLIAKGHPCQFRYIFSSENYSEQKQSNLFFQTVRFLGFSNS